LLIVPKQGEAMMPAARADKVKLPADLGKDHQAKLNAPKAAGKSAFDRLNVADELAARESPVASFSGYTTNGEKGELKLSRPRRSRH
jgi:hypothetical protein